MYLALYSFYSVHSGYQAFCIKRRSLTYYLFSFLIFWYFVRKANFTFGLMEDSWEC